MQICLGIHLSLVLIVLSCSSSGYRWEHISQKEIYACFGQLRGGQRTLPTSADSHMSLAQNSPYDKEAYLKWHILILS